MLLLQKSGTLKCRYYRWSVFLYHIWILLEDHYCMSFSSSYVLHHEGSRSMFKCVSNLSEWVCMCAPKRKEVEDEKAFQCRPKTILMCVYSRERLEEEEEDEGEQVHSLTEKLTNRDPTK